MLELERKNSRNFAPDTYNKATISYVAMLFMLGLVCLLSAVPAYANSNNPQKQILSLLEAGEVNEAFQLANDSLDEWEGEPAFDYALAMATKAQGKLQLAVFAFERVLNRQPRSYFARYYLAVTYFDMGQWSAAQHQFELLLQSQAEQRYTESVNRYLYIIKRQLSRQSSHWQNWIEVGAGNDSNANNGIEDEFINVPWLGDIRLFEQSREIDSGFFEAQAQVLYAKPISQQQSWYAGVNVQSTQYSDALAWDRTYFSLLAGYQSQWRAIAFDFSVFHKPLRLDEESYLDYSGMVVNGAYPLSNFSLIGASVSYAVESYQQSNSQDKEQFVSALWFEYERQQLQHKLVVRIAGENAKTAGSSHVGRNLWGASYQLLWQLNQAFVFSGKVDYLNGEHRAPEPLFLTTRKTELSRIEARLDYYFSPHWRASITINHMSHSSNIALYDYDRSKAMASIRYSF